MEDVASEAMQTLRLSGRPQSNVSRQNASSSDQLKTRPPSDCTVSQSRPEGLPGDDVTVLLQTSGEWRKGTRRRKGRVSDL